MLRLATEEDLPRIRQMYGEIVRKMKQDGNEIWDDVYLCVAFAKDIADNSLYVLENETDIVSAFVLSSSHSGEADVEWKEDGKRALYIDRFGVNVGYLRKGVGSQMLQSARRLAAEQGAVYLRLFVVDSNRPAIRLYTKNGFRRAHGVYEERIDDDLVLYEWGYEIRTAMEQDKERVHIQGEERQCLE